MRSDELVEADRPFPISSAPAGTSPSERPSGWAGALVGVVAGGVAVGIGQLIAGFVNPEASPVVVVGQAAIDLTPEWLKQWAIRTFGAQDKAVLLLGIAAVLLGLAIVLGVLSVRRPMVGLAGLGVLAVVGVAAALTRPDASLVDALPPLVGAAAGAGTLVLLLGSLGVRVTAGAPSVEGERIERPRGMDRRRFLLTAAAGAGVAVVAGGAGNLFARRFRADDSRAAVRIPRPASPAPSPGDVEVDVPGVGPFFTPNDTFYRVDTSLLVPAVQAEDWTLTIHGMVDREISLDYRQLLARPLIERDITLACVSNPVGGRYIGTARWIGAPLADLLHEAGIHSGSNQLVSRSVDGFTAGSPTKVVMDGRDAMLAVAMNGVPLPLAHGFPVRMLVPGLYGYVSGTKWVTDLELTTFDAFDPYWIQRGWAQLGPIKTQSRIDTPRSGARVPAGEVPIAGVAWAQHTGVDSVHVRIDEGPWLPAELAGEDTTDTWRQWVYRWGATPGDHDVRVRATDRSGVTQAPERTDPFPDGAEGQHVVTVRVT